MKAPGFQSGCHRIRTPRDSHQVSRLPRRRCVAGEAKRKEAVAAARDYVLRW